MPAAPTQREALLDAALHLMLAKGYWGTTVDQVCAAAGVTKGSFYHHFASKEDLAIALVDHYFGGIAHALLARRDEGDGSASDRLRRFLANAIDVAQGPAIQEGCILGTFAVELSQTSEKVRRAIEEKLDRLSDWLTTLLREVEAEQRARGALPAQALPPEALARDFLAVLEGGIILAKAKADGTLLPQAIETHQHLVLSNLGMERTPVPEA